jgi:hypothetical protein
MKQLMYITAVMMALFFTTSVSAQVGIGVSPANINPSAQLDVSSTTKGFLPPRMSETQRNLIASPAAGLTLWCSNCGTAGELQVYNGTAWTNMVGGAATKPVMIGDDYQGGKLAYILQQGDPGYDANVQHGLIAAISDQSTPAASWLNNGVNTITGATATAIGTGLANTNAIILSQGNTGTYAAKICRDYQGGGYTDWFLPSYDELVQLNINRVAIGGFANAVYWSSTETNNFTALWLGFFPSYQYNYNEKYHAYYVRAVRAF